MTKDEREVLIGIGKATWWGMQDADLAFSLDPEGRKRSKVSTDLGDAIQALIDRGEDG